MLEFVGVVHGDPTGRDRLIEVLRAIHTEHKQNPSFVAVEWAQATHKAVVLARTNVRAELDTDPRTKDLWSQFKDAISDTSGYEADAPQIVWPGVRTLWLDDGVETHDMSKAMRSPPRPGFTMAVVCIQLKGVSVRDPDFLAKARDVAWEPPAIPLETPRYDRDAAWLGRLQAEAAPFKSDEYGVVIVGDQHVASSDPNRLRARYASRGLALRVRSLRP